MESKAGFIFALIGGILTIISSFLSAIMGGALIQFLSMLGLEWLGIIATAIPLLWIVFGTITIIGAVKMNKPETVKKGALLALIFSILSLNVLGIVGGILGLVAAKK